MIHENDMKKIRLYIEGKLNKEEAELVKNQLKESTELFNTYFELKEALYLKEHGQQAQKYFADKILDMVKQQKAPHFKFIIRLLKDKVIVTAGGQEELDFQSVQASFAYRGDNEAGAISINRKINGYDVTIILTPIPDNDEFSVTVNLAGGNGIQTTLFLNKEELETIKDVSKQKMFLSRINNQGEVDLIFNKEREVVFSVNLLLKSEK